MAITYPVDVENTLWAVWDSQLSAIIVRNKRWPRADGAEIANQDPRYIWLEQIENAQPEYDPRLYYLETIEQPDPQNNTLTVSYNAVARDAEERKQAAINEEAVRLGDLIDLAKEAVQTRLVVTAIIKHAKDGETLPPKVVQMIDAYSAKGVKIWKNRDRLEALLAQIDAGQDPDLDAGWEG